MFEVLCAKFIQETMHVQTFVILSQSAEFHRRYDKKILAYFFSWTLYKSYVFVTHIRLSTGLVFHSGFIKTYDFTSKCKCNLSRGWLENSAR